MGYKHDQSFPGRVYRPGDNQPPVPQRASNPTKNHDAVSIPGSPSPPTTPPPGYAEAMGLYRSLSPPPSLTVDPRAVSTESLVPSASQHDRRKLLLIYVHGFMGNETSFASFPAHVHNLVASLLVETHVVHTKLYPKYKSRKTMEFARDDFSVWLTPHESPDTDVILLGHSMGGILAAELALKPAQNVNSQGPFRHRILGTISLDTPFLGMHPGIIKSGLSSLFNKQPDSPNFKPQDGALLPMPQEGHTAEGPASPSTMEPTGHGQSSSGDFSPANAITSLLFKTTSLMSPPAPLSLPTNDPNYNPPFPNDVRLPERNKFDNFAHFLTKHSDGLLQAGKTYVKSHIEFGGTMADFKALRSRYERLRVLEDYHRQERRIRFVNYYTASTGRPQKPRLDSPHRNLPAPSTGMARERHQSQPSIARDSTDDTADPGQAQERSLTSASRDPELPTEEGGNNDEMSHVDPEPFLEDDWSSIKNDNTIDITGNQNALYQGNDSTVSSPPLSDLPPLPPQPSAPAPFDPTEYSDKDVLKLAEKDHARQAKAYERAKADHAKAAKEREKLLEKRTKRAAKEQEKARKESEKARTKAEKTQRKQTRDEETARGKTERGAAADSTSGAAAPSAGTGASSADQRPRGSGDEADGQPTTTPDAPGEPDKPAKPPKTHTFCLLPSKDAHGARDPTWVRVFMQDVDEVGAHCGLFRADRPHYRELVGDVGERILEWVKEDRGRGGR